MNKSIAKIGVYNLNQNYKPLFFVNLSLMVACNI